VDTGRRSTRSASQCPVSLRQFNYSTSEVYVLFLFIDFRLQLSNTNVYLIFYIMF
jgi:hypothetical protein